jgi:hypothetical protein
MRFEPSVAFGNLLLCVAVATIAILGVVISATLM